ncbi:hypothetical protein [Acinetobacter larvae]|uniref:Iron transporter n=1 Tax=Acinetobacter larvae TaxID=1789224 RepID=A0A1B2M003_9GAMM|nr:hypothetical protein [Acinetobacter larvae]AOA58373.1 hypothetical protein BFG52_08410 [Acinetobacter larvae]
MISFNINEIQALFNKKPYYLSYRLKIFYRFILALVGGYLLASFSAMFISLAFSQHPASAVMSATMLAFIIHCAVFIWTFMVNSTLKASLGVIIPIIMAYLIYIYLKG